MDADKLNSKPQAVEGGSELENEDPANIAETLKEYLRVKYSHYSEQQIEELIFNFLNDYLTKNRVEEEEESQRSSLSSILDWNDKERIEQNIVRQIKHQQMAKNHNNDKIKRMSDYFGAMKVDRLGDEEEPDSKLNCKPFRISI
jgi:hypothetical protein